MLALLICILIALSICSYIIFDRDIFAPPTVVLLGFLMSSLCAFYNEKKWGLHFSSETVIFIVSALTVFMIGCILVVFVSSMSKNRLFSFSHEHSDLKPINIPIEKTILVIIFQVAIILLLYREVLSLTGHASWLEAIAKYRSLTAGVSTDPNNPAIRLPGLLRTMINVGFVMGFTYAYIVGNNLACRCKRQFIYWVPVLLSAITTFMQGDRSNMIRLWLVVLIVAFVIQKRSVSWGTSREIKKTVKAMAASLVGIGALFVILRQFVGRESDTGPLDYVTFYAGCPIAALDRFLQNPIAPSDIWGKETFYYTNLSLNSLFGEPEKYQFYKEFMLSPNGTSIGNVYTALRPPFYDFGFTGMLIVMLIMGAFFTFLYCLIRKRCGNNPIDMRLLLYCYIAYTFFMYFYNCYNAFLSLSFIKFVVCAYIVRWLLVGLNIEGVLLPARLKGNTS